MDSTPDTGFRKSHPAADETYRKLGFNLTFTTYYVWTAFVPQQPTEQVISG